MSLRGRRWAVALVATVATAVPGALVSQSASAAVRQVASSVPRAVALGGVGHVTSIAVGHADACAVLASTHLACWGDNYYGQLGRGTTVSSPRPVPVRGLAGVTQAAVGYGHTCALVRSGSVRCWGWNDYGQLGDGNLHTATLPTPVVGMHDARSIAVGFEHSCAVLANETVQCWGWNTYGQLGDGTTASAPRPVTVGGLHDVLAIAAGFATTCALLRSRRVACWGANASGELGDGTVRPSARPVLVRGLADVRSVSIGYASTCAALLSGGVECWGKNTYGQLGDGSLRSTDAPTATKGLAHVIGVTLGFGHSCALLSVGTVRCWGWNGHGQLGTGTTAPHLLPVPTTALAHVRQLAAGDDSTCALLSLGLVTCWGWNANGQLGDGTTVEATRPPYAPTAPSATVSHVGNGQVRVSWSAPRSEGVAGITGYAAVATDATAPTRGGQRCAWTVGPLACTITGLTNGDSYTFAVDAHNVVGPGPWSASTTPAVPATLPGAPRDVTGVPANEGALVSWLAPTFDGGRTITRYVATATDETLAGTGGEQCTWTTGPLDCLVMGLTNGDSYTFTVTAESAVGTSTASDRSGAVVPAAVPDAPGGIAATPGDGSAAVSWSEPASNGSSISSYTVTSVDATTTANGGQDCTTTGALGCTVEGLTNGDSYTFDVDATNAAGPGPPGISAAVVPFTTPGPPTSVSATGGQYEAVVSWTAPVDSGGPPVSGYVVTASDDVESCDWVPATPLSCTVTGLTNGDSYTFTVTASNGEATSAPSDPSNAVVPMAPPDAPISVEATAQSGGAVVTWASGGAEGSTITQYTVTAVDHTHGANGGQTCTWTSSSGALSCTFTTLSNGDSYTFTVTATNGIGTSVDSSPSNAVTPLAVPGAPTGVSATAGIGTAAVSWTAPTSDGGSAITDYLVTAIDKTDAGNGGESCDAGTSTGCTVDGLTGGDSYTFTVTATNSVGTGPASTASNEVTLPAVPDAPTGVSATAGMGSASVSWNPPDSDGGSAITDYLVTAIDKTDAGNGGEHCDAGTATGCTVEGLTSGDRYTFTVTATNAVGTGPASDPSNEVTIPTVPDAPTGVSATAGIGSASVTWGAPDTDGGSPITDYLVTATDQTTSSNGGETCDAGTSTGCTVTGLTSGDSYTFTVTATNAVGTGPSSSPSNEVTVPTVPDPPTAVLAVSGLASAAVSWSVPDTDGGSPITDYLVTATDQTTSSNGGETCDAGTSLSCTVFGLTSGDSYTFTVTAANAVGTSAASEPSTPIVAG